MLSEKASRIPNDLPVLDLKFLLVCYINYPETQSRIRDMTAALVEFMWENEMIKEDLRTVDFRRVDDFLIVASDLTPFGLELFANEAIDRWLIANDNNAKPISMRSLERSVRRALHETKIGHGPH